MDKEVTVVFEEIIKKIMGFDRIEINLVATVNMSPLSPPPQIFHMMSSDLLICPCIIRLSVSLHYPSTICE